MKRFLAGLLAAVSVLALTACTSSSQDAAPPEVDSEGAAAAGGATMDGTGMVFAGSCWSFNDTFINNISSHVKQFAEEYGASFEFSDAQGSQPNQTDALNGYITKGVNGLMVNIIDTTATTIILRAAADADLPVVFFEHEPDKKDMDTYDKCWTVGSNNEQGGTFMAELMLDYWNTFDNADHNGDGKFSYILIEGQVGDTTSEVRSQFIEKVLADAGVSAEMAGNSVGEWSRATAYDQMSGFISSIGLENIDGVLAVNDDMAIGCIEALKVNGYNTGAPGDGKYIPVVGIDGTDAGFDSMSTGQMWGTVLNDAKTYARYCTDLLIAAANGAELTEQNLGFAIEDEKYVRIDHVKVSQDNWEQIQKDYKS